MPKRPKKQKIKHIVEREHTCISIHCIKITTDKQRVAEIAYNILSS